jgi:hypothetical protein
VTEGATSTLSTAGTTSAGPTPDPVDWPTARRVARAVAGRDPFSGSYLGTSLARVFADVTVVA